MKKLVASQDITLISFYKSILDASNIDSIIKNYYLTSGIGDLPPNECVPELWVMDDNKFDEAKQLIKGEHSTAWTCVCGEKIPGQFAQCWKCGKLRE